MNRVENHVRAVLREIEDGREIPTKSIGMKTLNLESFQLIHKGGLTNIGELVQLKQHIDNTIESISWAIEMFIDYHKDSPKYWGKLKKCKERKIYNVSIDLENFMQEESEGKEIIPGEYFLPNNYVLADKVIEAFEKAGGDVSGIGGESFRECASWDFKSKSQAKKFVDFIDKTYVIPKIKEKMKIYNIKKIIFGEAQIDFEYKK